MPTFIDKSGDTGWKRDSLPFFRLGAVWLPAHAVEPCRESIRNVRAELGLREDYEFKFTRTASHPERRRRFFSAVRRHDFRFVVCGYDKDRLTRGSMNTAEFHRACAVALAGELRKTYEEAEREKSAARPKPASLDELV